MTDVRRHATNVYAIALNVPMAFIYILTARSGLPTFVRVFIFLVLCSILVHKLLFHNCTEKKKITELTVIFGSVLFWAAILLVYGQVDESNSFAYDLANVTMWVGIALTAGGLVYAYGSSKGR